MRTFKALYYLKRNRWAHWKFISQSEARKWKISLNFLLNSRFPSFPPLKFTWETFASLNYSNWRVQSFIQSDWLEKSQWFSLLQKVPFGNENFKWSSGRERLIDRKGIEKSFKYSKVESNFPLKSCKLMKNVSI